MFASIAARVSATAKRVKLRKNCSKGACTVYAMPLSNHYCVHWVNVRDRSQQSVCVAAKKEDTPYFYDKIKLQHSSKVEKREILCSGKIHVLSNLTRRLLQHADANTKKRFNAETVGLSPALQLQFSIETLLLVKDFSTRIAYLPLSV